MESLALVAEKREAISGYKELQHIQLESEISWQHDSSVYYFMKHNDGTHTIITNPIPKGKDSAKGSEKLPRGWNTSQDLYSMVYKDASKSWYLLKVIRMDDNLLVNFMRCSDEKVVSMDARISQFTTGDLTDYDRMFNGIDQFNKKMKKQIISQIQEVASTSKPRSSHSDDNDPLRVPSRHPASSRFHQDHTGSGFEVGGSDLDPFGRGSGGMFMDPMRTGPRGAFGPAPMGPHPGQLPRGAIPPGARFDPFGPPGTRPGPDPDHVKPPDYDDMFM